MPWVPKDQENADQGVFIAEEIDGVGTKKSGGTTMVDVDTLFEAFWKDFKT